MAIDMYLYSSNLINLDDFNESDFSIEDIAHSLSNQCRFAGHTKKFYSVAQHSLIVSWLATKYARNFPELKKSDIKGIGFHALMHDAHEAFIGDIPTPGSILIDSYSENKYVKRCINDTKKYLDEIIFEKFGSQKNIYSDIIIKDADEWACNIELFSFFGAVNYFRRTDFSADDAIVDIYSPKKAKKLFINECAKYGVIIKS